MLTVIANYHAKPDKGDEVAAILARHVALTRAERGCTQFLVNRSEDDPDRFVLYEQYVDEAAFQWHRKTPHFAHYVENGIAPLLIERTWKRYRLVEPSVE